MNQTKYLASIRVLFLVVLATAASAGILTAADYSGKFTLPVETRWGTATLPAGDYSFKLNLNVRPFTAQIIGKDVQAYIFAASFTDGNNGGDSALIIVRRGGKGVVRALHLAKEGLMFTYSAPSKGELPLMAQEPQLIQRIPVIVSGK